MKIIAQISTHKAVKVGNKIQIIEKGLDIKKYKGEEKFIAMFPDLFEDQVLYSIPEEDEDDVFAIMERYAEDNRCNLNELS